MRFTKFSILHSLMLRGICNPALNQHGAGLQIPHILFLRWLVLLPSLLFLSCHRGPKKPSFTDMPTYGEITVVCDESYKPLISVENDTFQSIYRNATVHIKYLPEAEAFKELVSNDSVRLLIAAREMNASEKEYFDHRKLYPRLTKIAVDAVALIVNNSNPDTLLRFEQLSEVVNGNIKYWSGLNSSAKNNSRSVNKDSILIVFDKNGSANARYFQQTFLKGQALPPNWFAKNSNAEVVNYVSQNKNALGVIGVNWISDRDDSSAVKFLQSVRVVSLSPPDTSRYKGEYFKPYQAYIALKQYPLIRDVYVINREGRNGLGTGFAAFLAGDQGQRIVRLMGMLPATVPVRLIQVH